MATKQIASALIITGLLVSCQDVSKTNTDVPIPIGEGTFVYQNKVYKILNNELIRLDDLTNTSIRKLEITKPQLKFLGTVSIDFIKKNASALVNGVYRGNYLYFRVRFDGINDLRENYLTGTFTLQLLDEFGFMINSIDISTNEIVKTIGDDGNVAYYEYNGKIELSTDAEKAISKCSIESSVKQR